MEARIAAAWADRLGMPAEVFAGPGLTVSARPELDCVVAVAMGEACVALCPPRLAHAVGSLKRDVLLDADALVDALTELARCEPIGTADLWFTDAAPPLEPGSTRVATTADLDAPRSLCSEGDWSECGLDSMPMTWVASTSDGPVAAAAGFADWGDLAHLGVLAAPASRGQGFADVAASRAVGEALESGRLAQWRCRAGNASSARLAGRLGFTRTGVQSAVSVPRED